MRTTIRITYVRLAERYRLDEVGSDGEVRTEISSAVVDDKAFAEHLAALVADYRGLAVSRGAIDDDGVVPEWGRARRPQQRTFPPRRGLLGAASTTRSPQSSGLEQRRTGS